MTHAIIGIREGKELRQIAGPGPRDEITQEFKTKVAEDMEATKSGGVVTGVLELFELRASRRHKLRQAGKEEEAAEPEHSQTRGRKRAGHAE
jgi:hypothetical protein